MIATVAVGTDGSETAAKAVAAALDLAERYGASLVILSAYTRRTGGAGMPRLSGGGSSDSDWTASDAKQAERILENAQDSASERGLECRTAMGEGEPGEVLVNLAEKHGADVIVVGNKGMHRRVLGSVPNTVTHRAPCSVFVVKTT